MADKSVSTSKARKATSAAPPQIACRDHPEATLIEDYHAGDMICSACGLVVADRVVDVGSEWRTFSAESTSKDMCRVGESENPLLDGDNLSTSIQASFNTGVDEFGKPIYHQHNQMSSANRALINAFREISTMCDRLHLPKMVGERANLLFKQVSDTRSLRGRSNDAIAAACLFIACRQENVPRSFKEMCAVCKISKKEIGRVFKLVLKVLETSTALITSGDFMTRFCSNLSLEATIEMAAKHIAKKAVDADIAAGRSPVSIAAAAIYMACQASSDKRSAREIGEIAGVVESTIKQSFRLMYPHAHDLFPPNFKFVTPISQLS